MSSVIKCHNCDALYVTRQAGECPYCVVQRSNAEIDRLKAELIYAKEMANAFMDERNKLKAELEEARGREAGMTQMYEELYQHHFKEHHTPDYVRVEALEAELASIKAELEDAGHTIERYVSEAANTPELLKELSKTRAELAEMWSIIDKTYTEHCGRDLMHLPLNEAVGTVLAAAQAELASYRAGLEVDVVMDIDRLALNKYQYGKLQNLNGQRVKLLVMKEDV